MSLYPFNDSTIHLLFYGPFAEYQALAIVKVSSKGSLLIFFVMKELRHIVLLYLSI